MLTSVAGTGLAHSLAAEPFLSRGPQSSVLSLFLAIALQRLFECYQMGDRRFNCHCEHEPSRRSNSLFRRHYVPWLRSLRRRKRMRRCRSMRRQRTKGCPRSSALRRRKALSITTNNAGGSGPLAELHCRIDTPVGEFNFCNQHQDPCPQKQSSLAHSDRLGVLKKHMEDVLFKEVRFKGISVADLLMDPSPEGEAPELESDVPSDTPIRRQGAHRLPEGRKPMFNFLEIIRRAVFLSAKTEPMQLPSYRAVELHVHRAELAFRLAIECVGGNQPSLHSWKAPNSGWEGTSESDIRIVWDDQVPSSTPSSCPPQRRRQQDECKCGKNGNASELCKNCVCTKNKRPCNETCCCTPQTCKNRFGRKPNSEEGHAATPSAQPPPYLQAQMSTSEAQGSEPQKQPIADEPGDRRCI